jgi:hypothetical protein
MAETEPDNLSEYFASTRSKCVLEIEVQAPCAVSDFDRMTSMHEKTITKLACFGDASGKSAAVRHIVAFFKIGGQEPKEQEEMPFCTWSLLCGLCDLTIV